MEFYERVSGARMHAAYIRPGGVNQDLPDGLLEDIFLFIKQFGSRIREIELFLLENRVWKQRSINIGKVSRDQALGWGLTGVLLRSTGLSWDLRKIQPYEIYDELVFSIPVSSGVVGDNFDRFMLRLSEVDESLSIMAQCINKVRPGSIKIDNSKYSPPTRDTMKSFMEALIHHFKLYSSGFSVTAGEIYAGVESPKGEFGVFVNSDSTNKPYRCKVRSPGFFHLQSTQLLSQNSLLADIVSLIGSIDVVFGEIDR